MSMTTREFYYDVATVNGNKELDYLTSRLNKNTLNTREFFTVDAVTENRLDLISLKYYGNYDLGWLIVEHNNILDPIEGIRIGMVLKIPALDEYYQFYNRNTRSK